jgi:hypothetical protein
LNRCSITKRLRNSPGINEKKKKTPPEKEKKMLNKTAKGGD